MGLCSAPASTARGRRGQESERRIAVVMSSASRPVSPYETGRTNRLIAVLNADCQRALLNVGQLGQRRYPTVADACAVAAKENGLTLLREEGGRTIYQGPEGRVVACDLKAAAGAWFALVPEPPTEP
jgi:hypothetical protein